MNFDELFPDERENAETLTRQCQLVMLRMLKIFDYLCTKHNIQYFLTSGTLLGAVRHKGFIPWDDDLDLGMLRSEYEKFVKFAVPELPRDIFFQNDETDPGYPSCHLVEAKLRDKYSRYRSKPRRWHNGLQLDLLIFDRAYFPNNYLIYKQNHWLKKLFRKNGDYKRAKMLKFIERWTPLPLVYGCSFTCQKKMVKFKKTYIMPNEISSLIRVRFEDMETWVPAGYHSYLKRVYGNYMELPPAYKQKGHHSNSNVLQIFPEIPVEADRRETHVPDPFTPCDHPEVLYWTNKKGFVVSKAR